MVHQTIVIEAAKHALVVAATAEHIKHGEGADGLAGVESDDARQLGR